MVNPTDIKKRVESEFQGVTLTLLDVQGLYASFELEGYDMKTLRAARRRVGELAKKAQLFNAHMVHGHVGNKRNWWLRV